jgi:Mg/Co/Ni transporter MgtE
LILRAFRLDPASAPAAATIVDVFTLVILFLDRKGSGLKMRKSSKDEIYGS